MSVTDYQYLTKILTAPVYEAAVNTDLNYLAGLSAAIGNSIYLKREDQQPVKSFKLRGAYNCMRQLSTSQKMKGVVTASAGNHAQGVAFAAKALNVKATIVMPETTPEIKVAAVKKFGGSSVNIIQHGTSFDQASALSAQLCEEHGYSMVPPFDHPDVIAGQGTIAKEMLEQNPDLKYLFIAVGGGGLISGIAVYVKQIRPDIKIIAVESEESACLKAAIEAKQQVTLPTVGIFADGVAVKTIGAEPFRLCQQHVDEFITVSNDEICTAIKDIFDDTRVIAEPAGALSIAGIRKYVNAHSLSDEKIGAILCGANINFHTLRYVSERCELGEQKEAVFAVKIPETKGSFKAFCELLGGVTITEFNYRYASEKQAHVYVGVKLKRGRSEFTALLETLEKAGYACCDMSDNELAKLHVRHMVGGKPHKKLSERVFSFEFPEYPGALMRFLTNLGEQWEITMFHYRNHGAAEGLVLAGFDIAADLNDVFDGHLETLGFAAKEHIDNPAYEFFLAAD